MNRRSRRGTSTPRGPRSRSPEEPARSRPRPSRRSRPSSPTRSLRRDVFALLARAALTDAPGLRAAITAAVRPDGSFIAPLVLVAGTLDLAFDELETLNATVTTVTPFTPGDKELKEAVAAVNELLQTPWLAGSTSVAEALTTRLKEAFSRGNRSLPAGYLDTHTDRRLLEQRHYRRRSMFGRTWLRAQLIQPGDGLRSCRDAARIAGKVESPSTPRSLARGQRHVAELALELAERRVLRE